MADTLQIVEEMSVPPARQIMMPSVLRHCLGPTDYLSPHSWTYRVS
jgi:hypothetical protein